MPLCRPTSDHSGCFYKSVRVWNNTVGTNGESSYEGTDPDLELRLRTELAERRVVELTAALENMKVEMDRWRTIAECRLLPGRRTESDVTRSEAREWWWRLTA